MQAHKEIDARGLNCPLPILKAKKALSELQTGEIRLSPELVEYRLFAPAEVVCWPAGTGHALAAWLRARGHEPRYLDWPRSG